MDRLALENDGGFWPFAGQCFADHEVLFQFGWTLPPETAMPNVEHGVDSCEI